MAPAWSLVSERLPTGAPVLPFTQPRPTRSVFRESTSSAVSVCTPSRLKFVVAPWHGTHAAVLRISPSSSVQRMFHVWPPTLLLRCLLYTSDAADERSSVDLGGRRIIK